MKKTTLMLGLSLAMFFGCKKENQNPNNPGAGVTPTATIYQVKFDHGKVTTTPVTVPLAQQKSYNAPAGASASHHAIANFATIPGWISEKANVTSGGGGGVNGEIHLIWPIDAVNTAECYMDASCLQVQGNVGIYRGLITKVVSDGGLGFVFTIGNHITTKVIDNGEGSRTSDQVAGTFFYDIPANGIDCTFDWFTQDWTEFGFFPPVTITSGQIQVK